MNITLNNLDKIDNLICFTDIPNILKIQDDGGGSRATFNFVVVGDFKSQTTKDNQWFITFMGDTITNVINPNNAINKNFYVDGSNISTAASIARAFRNCPTVAANFNIQHIEFRVVLTAKSVGAVWSNITNYINTNISESYLGRGGTDGVANSSLYGSKIDVDIYASSDYVTTLEKNYYGDEVAFNISPVLSTFAAYGEAKPYTLSISAIKNGKYSSLGTVGTNYISVGYMVNQGYKFLFNDYLSIAQNYSRGTNKGVDNNTILYVYQPSIPISFYNGNLGAMNIQTDYVDSANNIISSTTVQWSSTNSSKKLWDLDVQLNQTLLDSSFYIDLHVGQIVVRYNVIKPLKATEYCQRVYWRNSYGGISFFDFTGEKTETRTLEADTYEKNIFGFYDDEMNELEKIYDNSVKYTVTLKSHLFEKDGKYVFNDLLQSAYVWTVVNGQKYAIIVDSISVDESDSNDVYEATVRYHYSQEPSLI